MKKEILAKVKELGILAVIRGPNPDLTIKIVDALVVGGVSGIEITFTTPEAINVVDQLNKKYGDKLLLGMGTVTEPKQVKQTKQVGARFIVSPHTEIELAHEMVNSGLATMMGALTPSEFVQSYKLGSDIVKLFPGSLGGLNYLKALRGPFPEIPVMPTGGVNLENMDEWFNAGVIAVGVGSALFPKEWVMDGRFKEISEMAEKYCEKVRLSRE